MKQFLFLISGLMLAISAGAQMPAGMPANRGAARLLQQLEGFSVKSLIAVGKAYQVPPSYCCNTEWILPPKK